MPRKNSRRAVLPSKQKNKKETTNRYRFLIDQNPHKITGVINAPGLQAHAPEHESFLESAAIRLLALCEDVISIESQADQIVLEMPDGKKARYTTDLVITLVSQEKIRIEIKPIAHIFSEKTLEKLVLVSRHYILKNQVFNILSDEIILQEPRLSIVSRLRGFMSQTVTEEIKLSIENSLIDSKKKISEIISELGTDQYWPHILALIAQKFLCISWTEKFSKEMHVSLPNQPFGYLSYGAISNSGRFRPLLQDVVLGRRPQDRQLLAAACAQDKSVSLPSPLGIVGELPKRTLQVTRETEYFQY